MRAKVPGARIDFEPDEDVQGVLDELLLPIDETNARVEWGWEPRYDLERMVDDFLRELELNPQRYA